MNSKSKFVVFILSVIPGLSHIYLGLFNRGYIFMGAAAAGVVAVLGLCTLMHSGRPMILLLGLPVLWFVALIDSMTLTDKVNSGLTLNPSEGGGESPGIGAAVADNKLRDQNRKIITCLLSVIPGAGHMYLGYQKLGLELMTLFFFSFFFIDWLRIELFMFIIPVIWFYSMFDALHKASERGTPAEGDNLSLLELIGENSNRWSGSKLLGYGLILIGALLLFDRIISPMISYEIRNYLQTGIVALLFIAGGIRILVGGRKEGSVEGNGEGEEVLEECENGE
ncbi:MAG: hypothetical protein GXZ07_10590 [Firmicutes bacterium]|nr:hypothetical protein [Bacillota bacterium]